MHIKKISSCAFLRALLVSVICLGSVCVSEAKKAEPATETGTAAAESAQPAKKRRPILLDIRTPDEYYPDHIGRAINVPLAELEDALQTMEIFQDREVKILIYCQNGNRTKKAMDIFERLGFYNVVDLGGIEDAKVKVRDAITTFHENRERLKKAEKKQ